MVSRLVDGVLTSVPTSVPRSGFAQASRILAYHCHPAPLVSSASCRSRNLDGAWDVVDLLDGRCSRRTPDVLDVGMKIQCGIIRYCPYSEKFLESEEWNLKQPQRKTPALTPPADAHIKDDPTCYSPSDFNLKAPRLGPALSYIAHLEAKLKEADESSIRPQLDEANKEVERLLTVIDILECALRKEVAPKPPPKRIPFSSSKHDACTPLPTRDVSDSSASTDVSETGEPSELPLPSGPSERLTLKILTRKRLENWYTAPTQEEFLARRKPLPDLGIPLCT